MSNGLRASLSRLRVNHVGKFDSQPGGFSSAILSKFNEINTM